MNPHSRHGKSDNRPLAVRMKPAKKALLHEMAAASGTTASTLVQQFTDWWMGVPGAELPQRPEVIRDDLRAAASGDHPEAELAIRKSS
jgi:hypothetical protein